MANPLIEQLRASDPSTAGASDEELGRFLYESDPTNQKTGSLDEYLHGFLEIQRPPQKQSSRLGRWAGMAWDKLTNPSEALRTIEPVTKPAEGIAGAAMDYIGAIPGLAAFPARAAEALLSPITGKPISKSLEDAKGFMGRTTPSNAIPGMADRMKNNPAYKSMMLPMDILTHAIESGSKKTAEAVGGDSETAAGTELALQTGLAFLPLKGTHVSAKAKGARILSESKLIDQAERVTKVREAAEIQSALEAQRQAVYSGAPEPANRPPPISNLNPPPVPRPGEAPIDTSVPGQVGAFQEGIGQARQPGTLTGSVPPVLRIPESRPAEVRSPSASRSIAEQLQHEELLAEAERVDAIRTAEYAKQERQQLAQAKEQAQSETRNQAQDRAAMGSERSIMEQERGLAQMARETRSEQSVQERPGFPPNTALQEGLMRRRVNRAINPRGAVDQIQSTYSTPLSRTQERHIRKVVETSEGLTSQIKAELDRLLKSRGGTIALTGAAAAAIYYMTDDPQDALAAGFFGLGMKAKGKGIDPAFERYKAALPDVLKDNAHELWRDAQKRLGKTPLDSPEIAQAKTAAQEVTTGGPQKKALGKVKGLEAVSDVYNPEAKPVEQMKEAQLASVPMSQNKAFKTLDWLKPGPQMTALMSNSPLLRWVKAHIDNAVWAADALKKEIIHPAKLLFERLNKNELIAASKLIVQNEGKIFTAEELQALGYSKKIIDAYHAFSKITERTTEVINAGRAKLGKPPIKDIMGYFPHIFGGDWRAFIKDSAGNMLWVVSETTEARLLQAIQHLKKTVGEDRGIAWDKALPENVPLSQYTKGGSEALGAMHEMLRFFEDTKPEVRDLKQAMESYMNQRGYNYGQVPQHMKGRSTVQVPIEGGKTAPGAQGYMGNRPWLSDVTNAREGISASLRYFEKVLEWSEFHNAAREINKAISDPDIRLHDRRATELAKEHLDAYLGKQRAMDNIISRALNNRKFMVFGAETGNFVRALMLGHDAMFYAAQIGQILQVLPGHLTNIGKLSGDPVAVLKAFSESIPDSGSWAMGKRPITAVGKEAAGFAEKYGFTEPHFHDEIRVGLESTARKTYNTVTAPFMTAVDKATRRGAYMSYYHVFKKLGMEPEAAAKAAATATDISMVNYRPQERARIFRDLKAVGNMVGALRTFMMNQYAAPVMLYKTGGIEPMLVQVGMQVIMGGALGFYGINEAGKVWDMIRSMLNKETDKYFPSLEELIITTFPEAAAYGVWSSLLGIDIHNKFSAARFSPDSVEDTFPLVSPMLKFGEKLGELLDLRTVDKAYELLGTVPGPLFRALKEEHFTSSNGLLKNQYGGTVQRDTADRTLRFLGGRSMKETNQRAEDRKTYERDQTRRELVKRAGILRRDEGNAGTAGGADLDAWLRAGGSASGYVQGLMNDEKNRNLTKEQQDLLRTRRQRYMQEHK